MNFVDKETLGEIQYKIATEPGLAFELMIEAIMLCDGGDEEAADIIMNLIQNSYDAYYAAYNKARYDKGS